MRPYGKLANIAGIEGNVSAMGIRNQTLYCGFMERTAAKIQALATLVERGQVRPVIDSTFPLERVGDAHRKLESGGMKGKIVIVVS